MRLSILVLSAALLAASTPAALAQSRQVIGGANASLPFSTAVKAGGFIYVSGSIGKGGAVSGDIRQQTRDTLDGIDATLKQAGSSLANAASLTVYLTSAADVPAMNEVYATYFKAAPPARTTVIVTQPLALPTGLVEISAIGIPAGAERVVVHPEGWAKVPAPYSYASRSGNTLFMSGLVSRNGRDNSTVPGDMAAQTKTVMDNAGEILKAAGMGFGDVVQSRVVGSTLVLVVASYPTFAGFDWSWADTGPDAPNPGHRGQDVQSKPPNDQHRADDPFGCRREPRQAGQRFVVGCTLVSSQAQRPGAKSP